MSSRKFVPGSRLEIIGIQGLPEITEGDDLPQLFLDAVQEQQLGLADGDVIVITSKIVSKSEGRVVDLAAVHASSEAERIARETEKDPRIVQLVLEESNIIERLMRNHLIVETKYGFVCANAGVDESNVEAGKAVLLPEDPQESARRLRRELEAQSGKQIAVLIADSFGRAFRDGVTGICVGISGIPALVDRRGEEDRFGKIAQITKEAIADEICAAANLVMGEFQEGVPIAIVRGLVVERAERDIHELLFTREEDLFR
ncbi:MAG TPA: coenzyme F420-0:L-glutamate ligase [Methanomicrobia archaeon]|nr:coenzyme F420-0:L-glutamate ligase [Methanomicrobia archaeon]